MEKLEWRDVQLDGEPFLNVRAATTKNGKAAPIPIDDELASALRDLRGAGVQASGKVFESLPRIACFRADLAKAEIQPLSPSGERIDFHALRVTFQMRLTLNGVSPRVTMEAMRHSDMKLTVKTYTERRNAPDTRGDMLPSAPSLKWQLHTYTHTRFRRGASWRVTG